MRESTSLPHSFVPVGRLWDSVTKKGNYDQSRNPIDIIIIHTMEGTTDGSTSWFKNLEVNASAHYGVSLDGTIVQWMPENCTAYHAGRYEVNQRSVGIEHEDGYNPKTRPNAVNEPRPDTLYEASAKLVADISAHYQIPLDRDHIKLHREISPNRSCPGTLDVDRIINRAKEILAPKNTNDEQLVAHMMPPSVFRQLVTDSTNWNDFCKTLGIPDTVYKNPQVGKEVAALVQKRIDEATSANSDKNKPANGSTGAENQNAAPSNADQLVLKNKEGNQLTPTAAESIWSRDVVEVLKEILAVITKRVTL